MNKIAILLTCHNRRKYTLKCLDHLYKAYQESRYKFHLEVFLTDDGSIDGTSEAVAANFPKVRILQGNGSLYWAGGMRNSWKASLNDDYNGYMLLNDDTFVFGNLFDELFSAIEYNLQSFNTRGIIVGSTKDSLTGERTYGGSVFIHKFKGTFQKIKPDGTYQKCELGNANILYVDKEVVSKIGILDHSYIHGIADYDYTLRAVKAKIPVTILPVYVGICKAHVNQKNNVLLSKGSFKGRFDYLNSPTGLAFRDTLRFQKKFFPSRYLLVLISGYFKVLFPNFYVYLNTKFR